jgi:hypothetical protein
MFSKKTYNGMIILVLTLLFATCTAADDSEQENPVEVKQATIPFFNASGYTVDLYKNLNPEHFDPTTLVDTFRPGETKIIKQYPSYDQVLGDAFFPRYKIRLADMSVTGTKPIIVDAERVLTNITFVIESGKTYQTKKIPDVKTDELKFFNGCLIIENHGNTQIQIIMGTSILSKMDDNTVFINPGKTGYYEIPFSYFDTTITINQLKAFSDHNVSFSSCTMEKLPKKYRFKVEGDAIIGPIIEIFNND